MENDKKIAITIGDVGGISPEIIIKALNSPEFASNVQKFLVVGNKNLLYNAASELGLIFPSEVEIVDIPLNFSKLVIGKPCVEAGKHSFLALMKACELAKNGKIRAIVTAPLSKEAINKAGYHYSGQTEILEEYLGVEIKKPAKHFKNKIKKFIRAIFRRHKKKMHPEMLFVAGNLKVMLLTRHMSINSISSSLRIKHIVKSILALNNSLIKDFKIENPRIAICGFNPHSGENGLLGHEEDYFIKPALNKLRNKHKITIEGPFPADTLWAKVTTPYLNGETLPYDAYIACYHDQGLIPVKMLAMDKAVNTTINLSVIRTSPCHGTAYDIAGQNKANYQSIIESIKLADTLSSDTSLVCETKV